MFLRKKATIPLYRQDRGNPINLVFNDFPERNSCAHSSSLCAVYEPKAPIKGILFPHYINRNDPQFFCVFEGGNKNRRTKVSFSSTPPLKYRRWATLFFGAHYFFAFPSLIFTQSQFPRSPSIVVT